MNATYQPTRVEQILQTTVQWVRTHRERALTLAGVGVILVAFGAMLIHHHQTENNEAWMQLGTAQTQVMQSQWDAASKTLNDWNTRFRNTSAADYAQFLQADVLYKKGDYVGASTIYNQLAQKAHVTDMRPLALYAQLSCEEMAGHFPQAVALADQFLNQYRDHFLSSTVLLSQARLSEKTASAETASALYDRFLILYPQNPWVDFARSRFQQLTGKPSKN